MPALPRQRHRAQPEPDRPRWPPRSSRPSVAVSCSSANQQIDWAEVTRSPRASRTTRTSRSRFARCSSARPSQAFAASATASCPRPDSRSRSGTRSESSPRSRSASRALSSPCRTFHTGGVAGLDITQGLPRVVELFEARKPKGLAQIAEVGRQRSPVEETDKAVKLTITDDKGEEHAYSFPPRTNVAGRAGQARREGRPAERGLALPGRDPRDPGPHRHRGLHRGRGAARLPDPGRRHQRQAHRADRSPDAEEGAGGVEGLDRAACRAAGGPPGLQRDQREVQGQEDEARRHEPRRSSSGSPRRRSPPSPSSRRPPSRRRPRCSPTPPWRASATG